MELAERAVLVAARAERWWRTGPPLRSIEEAAEYVADVGFSLLFGGASARYPSLREASRDELAIRDASGWGPDIEAMWTWKDQLPTRGEAWLGRYLTGKQTLLAPRLLADLYEFPGAEDDALTAPGLTGTARGLAHLLLEDGPTSTRTARTALGVGQKEFSAAVAELGRLLLVTNYGVEDGPGWASCVLELSSRAFEVPSADDRVDRDARAAAVFVDTMVRVQPSDLGRAFGWSKERARAAWEHVQDDVGR